MAVGHLTTALEEAWAGCVSTRMQERGLSATEEARLDALMGAFGLNNLKMERHRIWSVSLDAARLQLAKPSKGSYTKVCNWQLRLLQTAPHLRVAWLRWKPIYA